MRYRNAVIITGPTTVGKTEVAVQVARKMDGEIINSDRLYTYSFLRIGSGLSDIDMSRDVPRHLFGILKPDEILGVKKYVQKVEHLVPEVLERNRLPIVEGCSSIYNPPLIGIDENSERSFRYNPVIALRWPREADLEARIRRRVESMFEAGLLEEASDLYNRGLKDNYAIDISAVYNPLMKYFDKTLTLEESKEDIVGRIRNFALMQLRRFERIPDVNWIEYDSSRLDAIVKKIVELIEEANSEPDVSYLAQPRFDLKAPIPELGHI